jgi:hypothetical protein
MGKHGVTGAIIPLTGDAIHELLHGRNVLALVASQESTELEEGDRIFFFDRDTLKALDGEGKISGLCFQTPEQVLLQEARLCVSREEFQKYLSETADGRKSRVLVLELQDTVKYFTPVKCPFEIPPEGKYMTQAVFREITIFNKS